MSWVRVGEIQSRHNFEKLKVFSHPRTFLLARNHGVRLLVVVVVIDLVVVVAVVVAVVAVVAVVIIVAVVVVVAVVVAVVAVAVVVAVIVAVAVVVAVIVAVVVNLVNVVTCKSEKVHCCVFYASKKKFFFSLSQRFFISQNLLFSFGIAFSLKTRAK